MTFIVVTKIIRYIFITSFLFDFFLVDFQMSNSVVVFVSVNNKDFKMKNLILLSLCDKQQPV